MRLLLDEHFSHVVAAHLRSRGHDVLAVVEVAAVRQCADDEVLLWAVSHSRAVVTENVDDFLRLHAAYLNQGRRHLGLILTTRRKFPRNAASVGKLIAALDEVLSVLDVDDALASDIYWL